MDDDLALIDLLEYLRSKEILNACWRAFNRSLETAAGQELRKGLRGGGRDLEKIIEHVLEADRQYLRRLAGKFRRQEGLSAKYQLPHIREAIFKAMDVAERG